MRINFVRSLPAHHTYILFIIDQICITRIGCAMAVVSHHEVRSIGNEDGSEMISFGHIKKLCNFLENSIMIKINSTNLTIMVKSMDSSIAFYESIGLKLKQRWGDHYAMVETSGLTIGIHPGGNERSGSGSVSVGFMVADINDAKAILESNKIAAKSEDDAKSGIYLHFKDPDGTILYFVQPKWS